MAESAAYSRRGFKGGVKPSTVPAGLSNSAVALTGADLATWAGVAGNGPFWFVLDPGLSTEEVCEATALAGNNITGITRGLRGTSPVAHDPNCVIKHVSTDRDFDEANRLVNAILGVAGLTAGDLLEVLTATTFQRVAKGTAGQLLGMNDTATGHTHFSTAPLAPWKQSVRAATTAALAAGTYVAGVFTETGNGALAAQDGVTLVAGDRLLVKNQAAGSQNGIYTVTQVGNAGAPFILTRATDFDLSVKVKPTASCWVEEGTANAGTQWYVSNTGTITLDTTALTFKQVFSSVPFIAQTVLSVATQTVSFTSIPTTFTQLRIVYTARGDRAATTDSLAVQLNGDTTAVYDVEQDLLTNATYTAAAAVGQTSLVLGNFPAATATANIAGSGVLDIPLYAGTTFFKTIMCTSNWSVDNTAAGQSRGVCTGKWRSTAAINRVDLIAGVSKFIAGSSFTLYGVT